jgi:hypothetical protein
MVRTINPVATDAIWERDPADDRGSADRHRQHHSDLGAKYKSTKKKVSWAGPYFRRVFCPRRTKNARETAQEQGSIGPETSGPNKLLMTMLVWLWANRAESRSSWAQSFGPFQQRNVDKLV